MERATDAVGGGDTCGDAGRHPVTAGASSADATTGNRYVEAFDGTGDGGAVALVGVATTTR